MFSSAITKNGYYYCYEGELKYSKDGSDFSVQETLSNSNWKVISSYEEMILYNTVQSSNHYIKYSSNGGSSFTQIEYSALENKPIKNAKYIKETNTFMLWSINTLYFDNYMAMFCMLFRKYIQGGNIVNISQVDFERIIKISVESFDELKEKTTKDIIIEIMGRHSNIILTHSLDNKIIDSAKRIPPSVSRVRQILPGQTYVLPPKQDKLNPLNEITLNSFIDTLTDFDSSIFKAIYSKFLGISPVIAKEICFRANIDENLLTNKISVDDISKIYNEFSNLFKSIKDNNYNPCIVIDENLDKVLDFSCINLSLFKNLSFINDDSMSKILESYYATKDIKDRIYQRSSDLRKSISIKLDRLYNKLNKQEKELIESENAEIYKIKGELITSYIYMIEKGMESVEVSNFYDLECKNIKIYYKS